MRQPSVGRIVHYRSYGTPGGEYGAECRAAVVTDLYTNEDEGVRVCVLNPTGIFFNYAAHDEAFKLGGTWHWPERTESDV